MKRNTSIPMIVWSAAALLILAGCAQGQNEAQGVPMVGWLVLSNELLDTSPPLAILATDPGFTHYVPDPVGGPGWEARVFLGSLLGSTSPVTTFSPLVGAELLLEAGSVMVELVIPIAHGAMWEYPYAEARPVIREYYERLGPERLAWGSDMPNVERHCTYKQSLDYLRVHCDFIRPDDMDMICGGNVARMFGGE